MTSSRLALIGVGLIGGSFVRALKAARACQYIVGCDTRQNELEQALALGVIDSAATDAASAVNGADVVVMATPISVMGSILQQIAGHLAPTAVITDVGSTKATVVAEARRYLGASCCRFVPGHPIAGTEKRGVAASQAELFRDHWVILTPTADTDPACIAQVQSLWRQTGARIELMSVEQHDEILAATSHLPHVLAYSLMKTVAALDPSGRIFQYSAGSFADCTRIAASHPEMWRDILLANREAVLGMISRFKDDLTLVHTALINKDGQGLLELLSQGKAGRDLYNMNRKLSEPC